MLVICGNPLVCGYMTFMSKPNFFEKQIPSSSLHVLRSFRAIDGLSYYCYHPVQTTRWFMSEVAIEQLVTWNWLHRIIYKQNSCNLPTESSQRAQKIIWIPACPFQLALWACNSQIFLVWGTSHLPKFSNSLIIHAREKWKLFTGVFKCSDLSDLLVIFLILISFICCFLNYALGISSCGRRGGLMVSVLVSGSSGPGWSPGWGHCVVFLGKTLYSHSVSLHPGV